ncbi:MAG: hypothetical protein CO095_16440 [Armatimonadetes bacterium CG_4_9_14_3_um_filter_58_7]|nr:MAG: hypothetical protein CO095_16440 [Armatimonadetes bacterium CG_4_9_14_3_um_filter_58_7]
MFYLLSKVLAFIVYPLSFATLIFAIACLLHNRRRRVSQILIGTAACWLYLCSIEPFANILLSPLESPFRGSRDNLPRPDAIMVLGGMSDAINSSSRWIELTESSDRLIMALQLARRHPRAILILSGGSGDLFEQSKRESVFLRDLAMDLGIEDERILVDSRSRNTRENAIETAKLLAGRDLSDVVLITSAFHMRRALGCFRRLGLRPSACAVDFRGHHSNYDPFSLIPDATSLQGSTSALREYVGLLAYKLQGYI